MLLATIFFGADVTLSIIRPVAVAGFLVGWRMPAFLTVFFAF
jgi:hypothetical protein